MWESALPKEVVGLLRGGVWPHDNDSAQLQERRPLVSREVIQRETQGDEHQLYFSRLQEFRTLAAEIESGGQAFWAEYGALDDIEPERLLLLGDFGLGSDAPFCLELVAPYRILRLQWRGTTTRWVVWADSLSQLLERLGLL